MSDCPACQDEATGIRIIGCRGCQIRDIAAGPAFFDSMRHGKLTRSYIGQLMALGVPIEQAHAEVKAAAKRLNRGSVAA